MRSFLKLPTSLIAIACYVQAAHAGLPIGIASGQPAGTNWPMVEDIRHVCETANTQILNVISDGSIDNIYKIYGDKNVQYGIVQADALEYQKGQDPKMMEQIQAVFPFFATEIHLVAREGSNISKLSDLQGKRVIEGPAGSGTEITAKVIKALTNMSWQPSNAGIQAGLEQVIDGTADAEFIVAGKPIQALTQMKGWKLVTIAAPQLDSFALYKKTLISSGTYHDQPTSIYTYKVDNVMATYAFKNQYQKEIGEMVGCIASNIDKLQTGSQYHPKWKDVNPLDLERVGWPVHPAALAAIKRAMKK